MECFQNLFNYYYYICTVVLKYIFSLKLRVKISLFMVPTSGLYLLAKASV